MANKKAETKRRVQNVGVKEGTIRVGAKGKSVRQWNAKTARWEKVNVSSSRAAASMRATAQASQITKAKEKQRRSPSASTSVLSKGQKAQSARMSAMAKATPPASLRKPATKKDWFAAQNLEGLRGWAARQEQRPKKK